MHGAFRIAATLAAAWITPLAMLAPAQAQTAADAAYPARNVRFIIPAPPGGANDIIGRIVANRLSQRTPFPWVVDNRPGASGTIAVDTVARAPADGYTMHVGNAVTFITNEYLFKNLAVNAGKDTVPVAMMAQMANAIVVPASSPFKTMTGLLEHARSNPGKLNYGSGGNGTSGHLFMELIKKKTGVDMVHIPHQGAGQMMTELLAGRIDVTLENLTAVIGHAEAGRVRILAVTSPEPWPFAPTIPTLQSQGIEGVNVLSWFGLFVPAKTPRPVLEAINAHVNAVLREPEVVQQLAKVGTRTMSGGLDEVATFIEGERRLWVDAVRAGGAQID